ncbi:MAG: Flp pilus assembly complex ATPase component TadA [Gammaproteobacteria bacterium]|nr:Flp pilus assembly complex ATPase component TadA [Gammaproteobacteria bacterium]MBU1447238.1 Flp pilus assembly complex ATPase component TadA [Gammaproteobacteria bacterium]MDD2929207.1 ATPase, T2SS/T4P/T4SS family [Sideroxydans sp.]MDD5470942.1 ATPase, T2SS/T4P/T4SS family [Sideroxydans sp.]
MARPEKVRLGDLLVQQKLISLDQLQFVLEQQKRSGRKLGRVLVDNGFISEDKISETLAQQLSIPYINLKYYNPNLEIVRSMPENQARRFRALALEERNGAILVGMTDPTDLFAFDEISRLLKRDIDVAVVTEGQLLETIDRVYRRTDEISGLAREISEELGEGYIDFGALSDTVGTEEAPVVKLLQTVFEDAAQVGASDVHIEPQETRLQIRFRIDGALHLQTEADSKIAGAIALRLKLMSGLDISEKRMPQDGRFNVRVREQAIDVRISTMPTQYGESVVMRLLNQSGGFLTLDKLGMPPDMLKRFREIIKRSNGMVLVTGPTGSGKTTTLYAALAEINTIDQKIITVEDPVEYRLPGINQVQVNEKIDLTFSRVLRSVLRQDPDVILVGEMRDAETSQIGMRAAMTGHLVFSTLHTRDSAGTLFRLVDMEVPKYMVTSSVQCVLAQRLLRRVCESCGEVHLPTPQEIEWLEAEGVARGDWGTLKHGRGCSHCNGTGFHGRMGVYEMLEMTQGLVDAAAHADNSVFMQAARDHLKGRTLLDAALGEMRLGHTSVAEVMRISNQVED